MKKQHTLTTPNLILRPFQLSDSSDVQKFCSDKELVSTTLNIPYPYEDGIAEDWIESQEKSFKEEKSVVFAITLKNDNQLIGAISLVIRREHDGAELAYWIGRPYWHNGFCTEASKKILKYGFQKLCLNKIFAYHMTRNPASGKVMKKIGMQFEGILRQHVKKWDQYEDLASYSMLRSEYDSSH